MNKKVAERLFTDRPSGDPVEYRRRKNKLRGTEQTGRSESSQRFGFSLTWSRLRN